MHMYKFCIHIPISNLKATIRNNFLKYNVFKNKRRFKGTSNTYS